MERGSIRCVVRSTRGCGSDPSQRHSYDDHRVVDQQGLRIQLVRQFARVVGLPSRNARRSSQGPSRRAETSGLASTNCVRAEFWILAVSLDFKVPDDDLAHPLQWGFVSGGRGVRRDVSRSGRSDARSSEPNRAPRADSYSANRQRSIGLHANPVGDLSGDS